MLADGTPLFDLMLDQVRPLGKPCQTQHSPILRLSPSYFPQADLAVGERITAFVIVFDGRLTPWGGALALYRSQSGATLSSQLQPVVELPCDGPPLLARPAAQQPIQGPTEPGGSDASPNRIFSQNPFSLAQPWGDFQARLQACLTGSAIGGAP